MRPAVGVAQIDKRHRSCEVKQRGIKQAFTIRRDHCEGRIGMRQASA